MKPSGGLTVSPGHVAGFGTDVGDFTDKFWDLANKTIGSVELPAGATGLLADLVAPTTAFRDRVSDAHQQDREGLYKLSGGLLESGRIYHEQEQKSASSLDVFGLGTNGSTGSLDHTSWGGAQFSDAPSVGPASTGTRQIVEWSISVLSPFEEGLRNAAGVQPVADFLEPVACDWGALQPLAEHIGFLGANDQALASNLGDGTKWLAQRWSGAGAQAFTNVSDTRRGLADERGAHMAAVSRMVRQGGACVEGMARNQASLLVEDLMRPMTFEGFSLPLGLWGTILDRPMSEGIRSSIRGALSSATETARSRHEDILGVVQNMRNVLHSESAAALSPVSDVLPQTPTDLSGGDGRGSYGFGGHSWLEVGLAFRPAA